MEETNEKLKEQKNEIKMPFKMVMEAIIVVEICLIAACLVYGLIIK